jgi:AraC-like DNA-binding protein
MNGHHDRASGLPAPAAGGDPLSASSVDGPRSAQPVADTLSDVLEAVRLTGALFFIVDASTPWVAEAPSAESLAPVILPRAQHVVSYHLVTDGACWCQMAGMAPVRIEAGDVIVVPHGDEYALSSEPTLRSGLTTEDMLGWFRQMALGQLPFVVPEGGGGPDRLGVVCGFLGCDAFPFNPILATLPRVLHVRLPNLSDGGRLSTLIDFAVTESREPRAGGRSVLLRIAELMFVEVVRSFVSTLREAEGGWLGGLRDPLVGRALWCLHEQPARAWTLDELAREAATSRSVLTDRFTHFVGQPPMHYLARWRMQMGAGLLADGAAKVSAVARAVGYESEAAFSRAFKKFTGVAPAAWRRRRLTVG